MNSWLVSSQDLRPSHIVICHRARQRTDAPHGDAWCRPQLESMLRPLPAKRSSAIRLAQNDPMQRTVCFQHVPAGSAEGVRALPPCPTVKTLDLWAATADGVRPAVCRMRAPSAAFWACGKFKKKEKKSMLHRGQKLSRRMGGCQWGHHWHWHRTWRLTTHSDLHSSEAQAGAQLRLASLPLAKPPASLRPALSRADSDLSSSASPAHSPATYRRNRQLLHAPVGKRLGLGLGLG